MATAGEPRFRIYYADGSRADGNTEAEWLAAPSTGVQVVVAPDALWEAGKWAEEGIRLDPANNVAGSKTPDRQGTGCVVGPPRDRQCFTGVDAYDPFGWGAKSGSLIGDADYRAIWERAIGDN